MKKTFFGRILIICASFALFGCARVTVFETARTLEPGERRWGFGVSANGESNPNIFLGKNGPYAGNNLELYYRYGLLESLDLKIDFTVFSQLSAALKYEIFSAGSWAFSIAAEPAITVFNFKKGFYQSNSRVRLHASYDFSDKLSIHHSRSDVGGIG